MKNGNEITTRKNTYLIFFFQFSLLISSLFMNYNKDFSVVVSSLYFYNFNLNHEIYEKH